MDECYRCEQVMSEANASKVNTSSTSNISGTNVSKVQVRHIEQDIDQDIDQDIESLLEQLSLSELRSLQDKIAQIIMQREQEVQHGQEYRPSVPLRSGRELLETRRAGRVTYQLEKVRCGKSACRCAQDRSRLHGPYWYRYRWNGQKVVSEYVGKNLPDEVDAP